METSIGTGRYITGYYSDTVLDTTQCLTTRADTLGTIQQLVINGNSYTLEKNTEKEEVEEVKKNIMNKFPEIEKYLINDNTVIVFFKDGTKEVAKCDEEDSFDLGHGIEICVCKKTFGHNIYNDIQKVIKNQKKAELAKLAAEEKKEADRKLAEEARAHRHERKLRQKAKKEAYYQKILQEELKKN